MERSIINDTEPIIAVKNKGNQHWVRPSHPAIPGLIRGWFNWLDGKNWKENELKPKTWTQPKWKWSQNFDAL